jgi:hypothetical protein
MIFDLCQPCSRAESASTNFASYEFVIILVLNFVPLALNLLLQVVEPLSVFVNPVANKALNEVSRISLCVYGEVVLREVLFDIGFSQFRLQAIDILHSFEKSVIPLHLGLHFLITR